MSDGRCRHGDEYELVVENAEVVNAAGRFQGSIGVCAGRIPALAQGPLVGRRVIDAAGRVVLPGVIDAHCQFRIRKATGRTPS